MTPEGQIQTKILVYLKKLQQSGLPLYYEKRQAGGFSYKHGIPDIYGVFDGIHFEVEVKRPGGERRADQVKWEERFKKVFHINYCCVDSIDIFKQWLNDTFLNEYYKKLSNV